MKTWTYGINTHSRTAHYWLEHGPWWAFFIRWLTDHLCDLTPAVPFPSFPTRDEDGKRTTLKEEWGDLAQWVHVALHMPLLTWAENHIQCLWISVPYEELKQRHYVEDKKFFDEAEQLEEEETANSPAGPSMTSSVLVL